MPTGVSRVAVARIFKLAAHIFILLLELFVDADLAVEWDCRACPYHPHLRRAIKSVRSFLNCSMMEHCLWIFSL